MRKQTIGPMGPGPGSWNSEEKEVTNKVKDETGRVGKPQRACGKEYHRPEIKCVQLLSKELLSKLIGSQNQVRSRVAGETVFRPCCASKPWLGCKSWSPQPFTARRRATLEGKARKSPQLSASPVTATTGNRI